MSNLLKRNSSVEFTLAASSSLFRTRKTAAATYITYRISI